MFGICFIEVRERDMGLVNTVTDFETVLQRNWQDLTQHSIDHVLRSMRRQVRESINNRGEPTLYLIDNFCNFSNIFCILLCVNIF